MKYPEIETLELDRLVLKPIELNDVDLIYALRTDAQVIKYTGVQMMTDLEQAKAFIVNRQKDMASGTAYYWCIYERTSKKALGTVCLWQFSEGDLSCHIGYELLPLAQGKGIMYAACLAVVKYAFKDLQRQLIKAEIQTGNTRSIRLIERLKFKKSNREGAYLIYEFKRPSDTV